MASGVTSLTTTTRHTGALPASSLRPRLSAPGTGLVLKCSRPSSRHQRGSWPPRPNKDEDEDILDTSLLYSNTSQDISVPKITQVMGSSDLWSFSSNAEYKTNAKPDKGAKKPKRPQKVTRRSNDNLVISTVEERDAYNVKFSQSLQQTHMSKFDLSKNNN